MGLIDRIKARLPIVGTGAPRPAAPVPTYKTVSRPEPKEEAPASPRGGRPAREYIDEVVKQNAVVIFMKGTPQSPACGFSASASSILSTHGVPYFSFDVYGDPDVREGVKEYSNWPTIPQIFISGEFVGGADILKTLEDSGELKGMLANARAPA
ncbi:MAG: Grx4 family monothiol glutaredoxin [Deltaproteobacteria bacterium]|nr:Grx4 family monothiol glutaredoxin [Deltaproteobacteria bacterium]